MMKINREKYFNIDVEESFILLCDVKITTKKKCFKKNYIGTEYGTK